jgi:hypothetical protein
VPTIYEQCGLRIRSEVELHLPVVDGGTPDVDITIGDDLDDARSEPAGEPVASLDAPEDAWWYRATETDRGFVLRFRDRGEFVISHSLDRIEVRRGPGCDLAVLSVLAAGTVMAFLLTLRGHTVLHASAVDVAGRALAFVGPSGRGKSTLAALLCLEGATLVTDDVLVVEPGPPVTAVGGAAELRLRPAAAPLAELRQDAPRRVTADERTALALEPSPHRRVALGAIVIPTPSRTSNEIEVERLSPSTALFAIVSTPRIHGWRRPDVLSRDFSTTTEVANCVPAYEVTVPWGPPFDPKVARVLSELASGRN